MRFEGYKWEAQCTDHILRAELNDTLHLQMRVGNSQHEFHGNARVADLLGAVHYELRRIARLVEFRALQCSIPTDTSCSSTKSELTAAEGEGLEFLVVLFCKYARYTSERRASVHRIGDHETASVLDHISSFIDETIPLLDVYSNAMAIRCQGSELPHQGTPTALRKAAS
jgi:hypothetical protein